MNKREELFNKLKDKQFIESEEDFKKLLQFVNYFKKAEKEDLNTIQSFWYYLKIWFKREDITNLLSISNPTFYTLNRYIVSGININVSDKLINRVKLLYDFIRWYYE